MGCHTPTMTPQKQLGFLATETTIKKYGGERAEQSTSKGAEEGKRAREQGNEKVQECAENIRISEVTFITMLVTFWLCFNYLSFSSKRLY